MEVIVTDRQEKIKSDIERIAKMYDPIIEALQKLVQQETEFYEKIKKQVDDIDYTSWQTFRSQCDLRRMIDDLS